MIHNLKLTGFKNPLSRLTNLFKCERVAGDAPGEKPAHRVLFIFTEPAYLRLEKMQQLLHKSNKAEVVRAALRLYEWIISITQFDPEAEIVITANGKEQYRGSVKNLK